jgi:hypothetical protein
MAWISYAIIALIFYAPCFNLGSRITEQEFPPPFDVAFSGYLLLLFYSLALWWILWKLLDVFEYAILHLFHRDSFRSGLLFARVPRLSIQIAVGLSLVIINLWGFDELLGLAAPWINSLGIPGLSIVIQVLEMLVELNYEPAIVCLSVFTLVVWWRYWHEQQSRYEKAVRASLYVRKIVQLDIAKPPGME